MNFYHIRGITRLFTKCEHTNGFFIVENRGETERESIVHSLTDHRAKVMNFYRASRLFHEEEGEGEGEWCRETRPFSSSWNH